MDLCQERRGIYQSMEYIEEKRAVLHYHLPLNEIIYDFFDALKKHRDRLELTNGRIRIKDEFLYVQNEILMDFLH